MIDDARGRIDGLFPNPIDLAALLDRLPLGVAILDRDRRLLFFNRALEALTGFGMDEVCGLPCRHVLRSNLCQGECPIFKADGGAGLMKAEGDIINRERRKISIRISVSPLPDRNGGVAGFMETVEDVTTLEAVKGQLKENYGFGQLLGRSPRMQEVFRILPVIAQTDSSVLITGETGTGKDVVAEMIHEASERENGPFIKINCGALPETLLESELFGHRKGAFTGAVNDKPGRIRLAHNGTLYLTEIGDLPLSLQVKLLTFLDDRVVYALGDTKGFTADVRIVAATHRNLERMVREGQFREDLLYRLNVVRVHLPPLRERGPDLELLLEHFLKMFTSRFNKRISGFTPVAMDVLRGHLFPGNVRELKNVVEYAVNICREDRLTPDHLPAYLVETATGSEGGESLAPDGRSESAGSPTATWGSNWIEVEKNMILDALIRSRGKRTEAARLLGWCRSTLWRKMKHHHLDDIQSRGLSPAE